MKHVCDMLMGNLSMKQVFSVVLSCGNYMNGGNIQRGQADGFSIDILPKLKDVKSRDNTTNLLQYVVRFCIVKFDSKKVSKLFNYIFFLNLIILSCFATAIIIPKRLLFERRCLCFRLSVCVCLRLSASANFSCYTVSVNRHLEF